MKTGNELAEFMKKNQINPASGVSAPLIQVCSFYLYYVLFSLTNLLNV